MAYYLVTARPKPDLLPDLLQNLQKHVYEGMRPFGKSLTNALHHARTRGNGYAVWEEEDYCSPPLAQERAAVLDEFFDDLSVETVEMGAGWDKIEDLPRLFPELETAE